VKFKLWVDRIKINLRDFASLCHTSAISGIYFPFYKFREFISLKLREFISLRQDQRPTLQWLDWQHPYHCWKHPGVVACRCHCWQHPGADAAFVARKRPGRYCLCQAEPMGVLLFPQPGNTPWGAATAATR